MAVKWETTQVAVAGGVTTKTRFYDDVTDQILGKVEATFDGEYHATYMSEHLGFYRTDAGARTAVNTRHQAIADLKAANIAREAAEKAPQPVLRP